MLVSQKQKLYNTVKQSNCQFNNFLKIRSEKQSIIHSDNESIADKVQGFQQLLKLTKTGNSITHDNISFNNINSNSIHKRAASNKGVNKSQSSKTFNVGTIVDEIAMQNRYFEQNQTDDNQMKKLNKMVYGVTEWQHQKQSFHQQNKLSPKISKLAKRRYVKQQNNSRQMNFKDNIKQSQSLQNFNKEKRKIECFTQKKKQRKFYSAFKNDNCKIENQLKKLNAQFSKKNQRNYINYPKVLLNNNLVQNEENFTQLRKKIKILQNKAKRDYGLSFQSKDISNDKYQLFKQRENVDQLFQNEKQNEELEYSELQIAPILAQNLDLRPSKEYKKMLQTQKIGMDSSIPKNLMSIVQKDSQNFMRKKSGTISYQRTKIKKSSANRPKSFAPSYTYIRI